MVPGLVEGSRRNPHQHRHGEVNLENAAFARFTVNPDKSVTLLRNSVDRRQTQPRAFSCFFGRIERFEDMNLSRGVHADACIADRQQDVLPGRNYDPLVVRSVQCYVTRRDGETPTF